MMLITSTNIEELLLYLKGEKPTLTAYSYVKFKHPKKTKGKEITTTFGRVLFNALLPEDYPFIDEPVDKKKLRKILTDIANRYDDKTYKKVVHDLQRYSLLLSTITPATIEVSKLKLPEELQKEKDELLNNADKMNPVEFDAKVDELYDKLQKYLEKEGVTFFDMVKSGTKGKKTDLQQLFIAWGPAYQPLSDDMPIVAHSLLEGLTPEEMYYGANKARFAAYLKSIQAAPLGYYSRKARWALADVKLSKTTEDCKTNKYFELKVTDKIAPLIKGRYYLNEKTNKLEVIDDNNIDKLIGKLIKIRSPLYCKAKDGICKTCYGKLIDKIKTDELGITATGPLYNILLNAMSQKVSHQKITAKQYVNFKEELKKFF